MTICSKLPSLQAHLAAQRKHWQGCRAWLVRIWSKMRGTRWGARKPNDEANFHTFCIIWDMIFLFRKYIRVYRNLTNRNMIPKFGIWYSYSYSLTVRGPTELAKEFATSDDVTIHDCCAGWPPNCVFNIFKPGFPFCFVLHIYIYI